MGNDILESDAPGRKGVLIGRNEEDDRFNKIATGLNSLVKSPSEYADDMINLVSNPIIMCRHYKYDDDLVKDVDALIKSKKIAIDWEHKHYNGDKDTHQGSIKKIASNTILWGQDSKRYNRPLLFTYSGLGFDNRYINGLKEKALSYPHIHIMPFNNSQDENKVISKIKELILNKL